MTQVKVMLFWFLVLMAGCATQQPRIPAEEIRATANQAFDELKEEEPPQKAFPGESKTEGITRSSDTEPRGIAQVNKGERPGWLDGDSARYPTSQYLIGVGYGPDRRSAEDNARSEIAKIFYSRIDSLTRTFQQYLHATSKGKSAQTESFDIKQITRVSTQKVLSGVRIAQVYQETEPDPIFFALAVLDRNQSVAILRHKIQELDGEIQRLLTSAAGQEDILIKIRYLKQSIQRHILREAYNTELRIVSQSGGGIQQSIYFTEIKRRLEAILLRDFLVRLSIRGNRAEEIREALVEGLNQQGFSVCEDVNRANVVVSATIEIKPLNRGTSEWKYVQWRTHLDLIDQRGGAVFGSVNDTGREGHTSLVQAEDRAVRKIRKALANDIARQMTQYIFSQ